MNAVETEIMTEAETESEKAETEAETEPEIDLSGIVEEYIQDEMGNPIVGSDGYAFVERETNAQGHVIREAYYDLDRKSVLCNKGYAAITFEYDEAANVISERYYDEAGAPVSLPWWSKVRRGNNKKKSYGA